MKVFRERTIDMRLKLGLSLTATVFLVFAPYFMSEYIIHLIILFLMYVILSESWNLLYGYVGLCSFGHAAFFGFGAYFTAFSATHQIVPFPITLILGGIAASVLATALSYPILRLRGAYFAIGMLGLNEILRIYFTNEDVWMHSAWGTTVPIVYHSIFPYYYTILITTLVLFVIVYKVVNSKIGLAFISIRESEAVAEMTGVDTQQYMTFALILSAFFPGMVGGFYAHYISYFEASDVFNVAISMDMIVMTLFGGSGTMLGPIIGTGALFFIEEILRGMFVYGHLIVFSILLIFVCLFMPGGILGTITGTTPPKIPYPIKRLLKRYLK
jgi:branched-chain amino acid transport system permease protein